MQYRKRSTSSASHSTTHQSPEQQQQQQKSISRTAIINKGIKYIGGSCCLAPQIIDVCAAHSLNSDYLCFSFVFFFSLSFYYLLFHLRLQFLSPLFSRVVFPPWSSALGDGRIFFYDRIKEYVRRGNGEAVF